MRLLFLPEVLLVPSEVDCPLVPSVISSPFGREEAGDGLAYPRPPRVAAIGEALAVAGALAATVAAGLPVGDALVEARGATEALGAVVALGPSAGGGGLFIEFAFVLAPAVVVEVALSPENVAPADTPNVE